MTPRERKRSPRVKIYHGTLKNTQHFLHKVRDVKIRSLFITLLLLTSALNSDAAQVSQSTYQRRVKEREIKETLDSFEALPFTVYTQEVFDEKTKRAMQQLISESLRQIGYHFGFYPRERVELILLQGATYDSIDDPSIATGGFYANKKIQVAIHHLVGLKLDLKKAVKKSQDFHLALFCSKRAR